MSNAEQKITSNVVEFPKQNQKKTIGITNVTLYNEDTVNKLKRNINLNNREYIAGGLEEENNMDNKSTNDMLLKYIDNLDKKYDDYKRDMVESEKRIYQNTKDAEERYEKRQAEFEKMLDDRFKSIDAKFDKIEEKFNKFEEKIDSKFELMQNEIKENNKYLKSLTITTNIGIAAMVISVVAIAAGIYFSLLPILQSIPK